MLKSRLRSRGRLDSWRAYSVEGRRRKKNLRKRSKRTNEEKESSKHSSLLTGHAVHSAFFMLFGKRMVNAQELTFDLIFSTLPE